MIVPYRLKRREHPAPTDALYVASPDVAGLVAVCARLPGGWPEVFRAGGGFVVVPAEHPEHPLPRTIRLRRLAGDLFVPVDAELIPALRPDEAVGLTHDRGLVVLPGGEVLTFDLESVLTEVALLSVGPVERTGWTPFPERPPRADKLHVIRADLPPSAVVEILISGKPDGSSPLFDETSNEVAEDARPPKGSFLDTVSANVKYGAGKFLNWIGQSIGAAGWAQAGADLVRKAMEQVPRISESDLGAQEAALREQMRQLQGGDVEQALRRAPIAVADPNAPPGRVDSGSRLSDHNTQYSLRSLLGGGGLGSAWLGGGDVWSLLAAQYRKLAEDATRRGDYRRAAYLYGVLLRDPRAAARVLDSGGLHRDAAILYRDKLGDYGAAAACYVRGGCWDEAVELYQRLEQYEHAGDVFRRIGDEESALTMYVRAADRLAERSQYVAAGDLIRNRVGLGEVATRYYSDGWAVRGTEELQCGERLLDACVQAEQWSDVTELVEEAAERFAPPRAEAAGTFFTAVVRHADQAAADVKADLKDRARLVVADHLRHAVRAGRQAPTTVTTLFGGGKGWGPAWVRDAREAVRLATLPCNEALRLEPFRLLAGPIVAAVVARERFGLVLANANGSVVLYHGGDGGVVPVAGGHQARPVSLATDGDGRHVVVLVTDQQTAWLESFEARGSSGYQSRGVTELGEFPDELPYLQPDIAGTPDAEVRLFGPDARRVFRGPALLAVRTWTYGRSIAARFACSTEHGLWIWRDGSIGFAHEESFATANNETQSRFTETTLPWWPAVPSSSEFGCASVDWLRPAPDVIEVAGIDADGAVYWSEARLDGDRMLQTTATTGGCYRAACLFAPGRVAAVTADNQFHWLAVKGNALVRRGARRLDHLAAPVFVTHRPEGNEVVVVFADGWAIRVPKP